MPGRPGLSVFRIRGESGPSPGERQPRARERVFGSRCRATQRRSTARRRCRWRASGVAVTWPATGMRSGSRGTEGAVRPSSLIDGPVQAKLPGPSPGAPPCAPSTCTKPRRICRVSSRPPRTESRSSSHVRVAEFGHMASLLDVGLVDDRLTRKDILEVPGDDGQQILWSAGRRGHGISEAGLPFPG